MSVYRDKLARDKLARDKFARDNLPEINLSEINFQWLAERESLKLRRVCTVLCTLCMY